MLNRRIVLLIFAFMWIGYVTAEVPVIQTTGGSANLKQTQGEDVCLHPIDTDPDADSCTQTSSFPQFTLRKETGNPDYCVYFLANNGALVHPWYNVTFTCDDGDGNDTTSFVKIDIIPNAPPTFAEGGTVLKFVDASAISNGDTLFTATATDTDGDSLSFSLNQTFTEFSIQATRGDVLASVDFNTLIAPSFSFEVRMTDNFTSVVKMTVILKLININTPPKITNLVDPLTYPEDVPTNFVLYSCMHDEPVNPAITFDVSPASEVSTFGFNPATCKLWVKTGKKLDFETVPTMTMTLTLDDGVYSRAFPFTFNVLNANDPPTFASNSYTMDIDELPVPALPPTQPTFVVSDEDAADTYTFSLGTGSYEPYFTIDGTTGALTCIKELDYDAGITQVMITVIATDSGGESASTTLTVNVADYNDNDPEFSTSTTLYISPKTPVGKIGEVVGTDKDTGINAMLTYSKVSDSSGGKFQVQPDGSVRLLTPLLEAERNDIYYVVARATDGGLPQRSGDTTIIILFNPPPVITNMPNVASISEDTSIKKDLFQIAVTDDDNNYSCTADAVTPSTTNAAFVVEQKTGGSDWFVFYTGLERLSFSRTPNYFVNVICTDSHDGKSIKGTLTVFVRQNQPPFMDCTQTLYIVNASIATTNDVIHTVVATDDDPLTYEMSLTPSSGTFTINPTNGEIVCQKPLFRETVSKYTGVITVSDTLNSASCSITLTMTGMNEAPVFNDLPKTESVDEDARGGTLITKVTISDAKECDPITFTWDVDPVTDRAKFTATLTNNVVSLSLASGQKLDHETVDEYIFTFKASDGCLESQAYPLYLAVSDINEPPKFLAGDNFTVDFYETFPSSPRDVLCNGWDPDVWDSHTLTLSGNNWRKFSISDPSKCTLGLLAEHDRDIAGSASRFRLIMTMTDKAGLSATATVNINVYEVNDNVPICDQPAFTFADIYNGDTIGRQLGRVRATDADKAGTLNSKLLYSIVAPSTGTNIVECTSDGRFKVIADPEAQFHVPGTLFDYTVKVRDDGTPPLSTTCKVNIQYIYTTTTTTTTLPPPPIPSPAVDGTPADTASGTGVDTTTAAATATPISSVDQALSNPVILGLVAATAALAALAAIAGIVFCCMKFNGGSTGTIKATNNGYGYTEKAPSRMQSRGSSNESPTSKQVDTNTSDIWSTNKVKPDVDNTPTTLRYLKK